MTQHLLLTAVLLLCLLHLSGKSLNTITYSDTIWASWCLDCLFNSPGWLKKYIDAAHLWPFAMRIHRPPMDSPHKGSVMQQAYQNHDIHYNYVIMGAMTSQITILTIVYSTVLFRRRSKKTSNLRVTGLCAGNSPVTGEFPAQMASNQLSAKCFHLMTSSWSWLLLREYISKQPKWVYVIFYC